MTPPIARANAALRIVMSPPNARHNSNACDAFLISTDSCETDWRIWRTVRRKTRAAQTKGAAALRHRPKVYSEELQHENSVCLILEVPRGQLRLVLQRLLPVIASLVIFAPRLQCVAEVQHSFGEI